MRCYVIGRSQFADIVLADRTVASRHAELVETADRRWFLTDCASEGGSFLWTGEGRPQAGPMDDPEQGRDWLAVRQGFVTAGGYLCFGNHVSSLRSLIAQLPDHQHGRNGAGSGGSRGNGDSGNGAEDGYDDDLPFGPVERDPLTGEIVRRSL